MLPAWPILEPEAEPIIFGRVSPSPCLPRPHSCPGAPAPAALTTRRTGGAPVALGGLAVPQPGSGDPCWTSEPGDCEYPNLLTTLPKAPLFLGCDKLHQDFWDPMAMQATGALSSSIWLLGCVLCWGHRALRGGHSY